MLCAAIAAATGVEPERGELATKVRERRLEAVLSYERAWALACALSGKRGSVEGLLGIRSVNHRLAQRAVQEKSIRTNSFQMLSRQVRYGGLGIYGTLLEASHVAVTTELKLRPAGEDLAAAFPHPPDALHVCDPRANLSLDTLAEWGKEAHPARMSPGEAKLLRRALSGGDETESADQVRWSALRILARYRDADEAALLQRIYRDLCSGAFDGMQLPSECLDQIRAVLVVVEPFESFYQTGLFLFQTLRAEATQCGTADLEAVVGKTRRREALRKARFAGKKLLSVLDGLAEPAIIQAFCDSGVSKLAQDLSKSPEDEILPTLVRRHTMVQAGKFDGSLPKGPWIRLNDGGDAVVLTAQRYQLPMQDAPTAPKDVSRHPYRTHSAYRFIRQCGIH
jgi:hypothetical protein